MMLKCLVGYLLPVGCSTQITFFITDKSFELNVNRFFATTTKICAIWKQNPGILAIKQTASIAIKQADTRKQVAFVRLSFKL